MRFDFSTFEVEPVFAELRRRAVEVSRRAYAPYSKFPVGAAAQVDDGRIVVGCNVENAGYGVTLCAECGVVSQLHATGGGRLIAFACVDAQAEVLMPCGRCRQLLWENGGPELLIDTPDGILTMAQVLPYAFGGEDLDRVARAREQTAATTSTAATPQTAVNPQPSANPQPSSDPQPDNESGSST